MSTITTRIDAMEVELSPEDILNLSVVCSAADLNGQSVHLYVDNSPTTRGVWIALAGGQYSTLERAAADVS